jgi:hypothetical protein
MRRRLRSFLVRVWDGTDGTVRVEIEHIQDGAHVVVDSTAAALGWIDARAAGRAGDVSAGGPGPVKSGPRTEGEPPP